MSPSCWRTAPERSSISDRLPAIVLKSPNRSPTRVRYFLQLRQRLLRKRAGECSFERIEHVLDREGLTPQAAASGIAGFQRCFVCGENRVGVDYEHRQALLDDRRGQRQHLFEMIEASDVT